MEPVDITDELEEIIPDAASLRHVYRYRGPHAYFEYEDAIFFLGYRLRDRHLEQYDHEVGAWRDVTAECEAKQTLRGGTDVWHRGKLLGWCYSPWAAHIEDGRVTITRIPKVSYAEMRR